MADSLVTWENAKSSYVRRPIKAGLRSRSSLTQRKGIHTLTKQDIVALQALAIERANGDKLKARLLLKSAHTALASDATDSRHGVYAVQIQMLRYSDTLDTFALEADTDAGLAEGALPRQRISGQANVVEWIFNMIQDYHHGRAALTLPDLTARLPGLRVSLSRSGGDSLWHVPHQVGDESWQAIARIVRIVSIQPKGVVDPTEAN